MIPMKPIPLTLLVISLTASTNLLAVDTNAVIGGAVGGGAGAAIGSEVGGKEGAIIGSAIGAAVGTAVTASDEEKSSHSTREVIYVEPAPAYRHVPPGHAKHWHKHKHKYR